MRGLRTKEHDTCEYAIIPIYISGKDNKVALIRREFHIVDNLSVKVLVGIDVMKSEDIILDTNRDLAVISSCGSLEVPMSMVAKGQRTDTVVVSKARHSVPAYTFITVPIEPLHDLPQDRDLIFEPDQLEALTLSAHIVDHNLERVMVHNDTDLPIILPRHLRLGKVQEYEAAGCFQIDSSQAPLAAKPPKKCKTKSWVKRGFQGLLGLAAAFSATTLSGQETIHATGATIYNDVAATNAIANVVESFPNIWRDTGNARIHKD